MSDIAIKVEGLGKQYRLGEIGTGTISHDLNRWFARLRGKEDPFAKVGEANDRTQKGNSDYVWSLRDVSFEVKKGEVLGIIGRNGAGKSTLLKILSKVTAPTTGNIKVNGRIASLLEVGTGFHPELTGRENIFLNGAILGMTKTEIRSKFDEIVDFSGVERYIDTPVKRYSSGMYVRLAFAVAAFLEPEILIVDEVLAVGDAEFQKKCLGRMKEVSVNDGRTVLFVSHNMAAVQKLCTSGLMLAHGSVIVDGSVPDTMNKYLEVYQVNKGFTEREQTEADSSKKVFIRSASLIDGKGEVTGAINNDEQLHLNIEVDILKPGSGYNFNFELWNVHDECVFSSSFFDNQAGKHTEYTWQSGSNTLRVELPIYMLKQGNYRISIASVIPTVEILDIFPAELQFHVNDVSSPIFITGEGRNGVVIPILNWSKQ